MKNKVKFAIEFIRLAAKPTGIIFATGCSFLGTILLTKKMFNWFDEMENKD